jgi:hypothetical protein
LKKEYKEIPTVPTKLEALFEKLADLDFKRLNQLNSFLARLNSSLHELARPSDHALQPGTDTKTSTLTSGQKKRGQCQFLVNFCQFMVRRHHLSSDSTRHPESCKLAFSIPGRSASMNATFTMPIRNCNATARFVMRIAQGIVALAVLEVYEIVAQPSPSRPQPERINTCKPKGKRLPQTENTYEKQRYEFPNT